MIRFLALLLLFVCGRAFAADQSASGLYLNQQHFTTRSKALSGAVFVGDGSVLATGSLTSDPKGAIQLWNVKTGECIRNLLSHAEGIYSLAASSNGRTLACGCDAGVALYDVTTGKESIRITLPPGRVLALAFAPDGSKLAAAGEDKQLHFLDNATGKLISSLVAHDDVVTSLVFAPDGTTLYSGSYDGTVKAWSIADKKLKEKLTANGGRIHGVAISADGKTLAAACAGNPYGEVRSPEVALWNLGNLKQRKSLRDGGSAFTSVHFSGAHSMLAAARADGWVVTWGADGRPCSRLHAHSSRLTSLSFSPDGRSLVTTSWEAEAKLWDLPRWKLPVKLPGEFASPAALVYDPHLQRLIVGGMEKVLHLVDPAGKKPGQQLQLKTDSTQALAISADGKILAATGGRQDAVPPKGVRRMRFGVALPQAAKPELITLWDLENTKELRTFAGHQGLIGALAFSADASLLASAAADKTVRVWNVAQGVELMQLIGHASTVVGVVFHPGKKTLASASDDGVVRIWDLRTGEIRAFQAHPNGLNGLAYSPDGRWMATSATAHGVAALALWDAETAENRWLLPYPGAYLSDVTFSPDGRLVLAVGGFYSEPGLVRIIDVERGRPKLDLLGGKTFLAAVCFSPDGKSLFAAGQTGENKGELLHWLVPAQGVP